MDECKVMVSILCAAYNHERYIRSALDGFLSQRTDFRYEVIVHDDASTDSTAEIIREYEARYPDIIRPIYQTENQYSKGISITNAYMRPKARGKYIAFCEGDDYWTDPNKLQKQVDFLETHPEYSASTHNCCFVDENDGQVESLYPVYRRCRSHRYTLKRFSRDVVYPGQTATIVHRKSAYAFESEEARKAFFGIRAPTGDKQLMLRLLLSGDIFCFEDVMSAYRIASHGSSSWSAANYGKNRSHLLHFASIDVRKYVRKYHGKQFANYFTTFHTGVAGIMKYLLQPNEQNKEVCAAIIREHHGVLGTAIYLFGLAIISIPLCFIREQERHRYDPEELD